MNFYKMNRKKKYKTYKNRRLTNGLKINNLCKKCNINTHILNNYKLHVLNVEKNIMNINIKLT